MDDKKKTSRPMPSRGSHRKPAAPRSAAVRDDEPEAGERIAKRLARAGVASRREAETMIAAGRISVNGKTIDTPALNVSRADRVEIDGRPIPEVERTRLFLFHKPAGHVTTNHDPEGRPTVFDILPEGLPRLMTIGRLDMNTEGLLLLTNDGGLARVLELPSTGWLRRYRVRVHGEVDEAALAKLSQGIAVDGVYYGAIDAVLDRRQGTNAWLTLGLREGKNREVRNVLGALGLEVTRLIRISYGPFQLAELAEGEVLELKGRMLRDQLGPRLIEEAGADFESPVTTAFSNSPVAGEKPRQAREGAPRRERPMPEAGEGGLIKRRRPDRQERRGDALDRLSTKPARTGGDRPRGEKPRREEEPKPAGRRNVNVWMAPGARPKGPKPVAARNEEARERPPRKPRPDGAAKRVFRREDEQDGDNARPARKIYRPGKAERQGLQYEPKGPPRGEAGAEARRPRPDRKDGPARSERQGNDRPFREKPFGGARRPDGEDAGRQKREARPERPFRERPSGGRDRAEKAGSGERAFGKKPFGGPRRPESDDAGRPKRSARPERPFRERPSAGEGRSEKLRSGERPAGKKPFAGAGERGRPPRKDGPAKPFRPRDGGGDVNRPKPKGPRGGGARADRRR